MYRARKNGIKILGMALIAGLLIAGISPGNGLAQTRKINDMTGRTVTLPQQVQRIAVVTGACNIPEMITALGDGEKLVGGLCFKVLGGEKDPDLYKRGDWQIKVVPALAKVEQILAPEGQVNIETLLKLKPDVAFVWQNVKNVDAIQSAGVPVMVMDLSSWDKVKGVVTMVGAVLGKEKRANELTAYTDRIADLIEKRVSSMPAAKRKKVLLLVYSNPLTVMGGPSHNRFLIEKSGGINLTNDLPQHYSSVSMEHILKMDPDIILIQGSSETTLEELKKNSLWKSVRAVKEGRYFLCPRGVYLWDKPCAETPLFMLWQSHLFYPELFKEEELKTETRTFFQKYFNQTLTEADLKSLLFPGRP